MIELDVRGTKVTESGVRTLATSLPKSRIEWDGPVFEPKEGPDRAAAEWVLSLGGAVSITIDGRAGYITFEGKGAKLPAEQFKIYGIDLNGCKFEPADLKQLRGLKPFYELAMLSLELHDEDLKHLEGVPVEKLVLFNNHFTGGGLAHLAKFPGLKQVAITLDSVQPEDWQRLKDIAQLETLTVIGKNFGDGDVAALLEIPTLKHAFLDGTALTDAGVEQLLKHPNLRAIALKETEITDKSLELLAKSPQPWERIDVSKTKVTKEAVERLKAALPKCEVMWMAGDESQK
jgi:eukaryotic-like serine/threonine-protein kinase